MGTAYLPASAGAHQQFTHKHFGSKPVRIFMCNSSTWSGFWAGIGIILSWVWSEYSNETSVKLIFNLPWNTLTLSCLRCPA